MVSQLKSDWISVGATLGKKLYVLWTAFFERI